MSSANPFTPQGNTVTFTANATAPTPVQASTTSNAASQYLVQNAGAYVAFLGYGATAALANTAAVTVTSSQSSIPLLPGSIQVLTLQPNLYFTGVAAGACVIYIAPGEGS